MAQSATDLGKAVAAPSARAERRGRYPGIPPRGNAVPESGGPGAHPAAGRAGPATDGGTLSPGAVADVNVLSVYLPKVVDTLITAGVPVHPGTISGAAVVTPGPATPAASANSGAVGKTQAAATASASTEGSFPWALGIGLLGLLAGSLVIALGSLWRKNHSQAGEPSETTGGVSAMTTGGSGSRRIGHKKGPTIEPATIPETRFSDVAGCDEAKAELLELVMFLKEPERFTRTGATAPKGALLTGPPGTGKTLLARAIAGESGVPMFTATGSDFVDKYVGSAPSASGPCSPLRASMSGPSSSSTRWTRSHAVVAATAR